MAKETKIEEEKKELSPAESDRQRRWEQHRDTFEKTNPDKYALRRATTFIDDNAGTPLFGTVRSKPDELPDEAPAWFL